MFSNTQVNPRRLRNAPPAKTMAAAGLAAALVLAAGPARGDLVGAYVETHGAMAGGADAPQLGPGVGFEVAARLLFLEASADHTNFGDSQAVSRAMLGLRLGIAPGKWRFYGKLAGGAVHESEGALTGAPGMARWGISGRLGAVVERRLAGPIMAVGAITGERFTFIDAVQEQSSGSLLLGSLGLRFELSI